MFLLHDMMIEAVTLAAVLVVFLLVVFVAATAARDWSERRSVRSARVRLRRRAWDEYLAASSPPTAGTPPPAPQSVRRAGASTPVPSAVPPQTGLSARPA
jgi:hypothetical protein